MLIINDNFIMCIQNDRLWYREPNDGDGERLNILRIFLHSTILNIFQIYRLFWFYWGKWGKSYTNLCFPKITTYININLEVPVLSMKLWCILNAPLNSWRTRRQMSEEYIRHATSEHESAVQPLQEKDQEDHKKFK